MRKRLAVFLAVVLVLPVVFAAPAAAETLRGEIDITLYSAPCPNNGPLLTWYGSVDFDGKEYGKAYFPVGEPVFDGAGGIYFEENWTIFTLPDDNVTLLDAACDASRVVIGGQDGGFGILGDFAYSQGTVTQFGPAKDPHGLFDDGYVGARVFWEGVYVSPPTDPLQFTSKISIAELPPSGTFVDDDGNSHEGNIEAIAAAGITEGCNPPTNDRYCPGDSVTRAQMAAFLLRGTGEADNLPVYQGLFSDVPAGLWYTPYTERLYQLAITTGCLVNPLGYCPSATVSRAEMAAFILRAIDEDQNLTSYRGYFSDVPAGAWYAGYAERLFELGISTGCTQGKYCPDDPVRRDEMASFLARALGLIPIVPPTSG
jgi:hypothetical protein